MDHQVQKDFHLSTQEEEDQVSGFRREDLGQQMERGIQLFDERKYIEAIEVFATMIALTNDDLARQYLARCYFRLELYEVAYRHYQYISEHCTEKHQSYGISMVAAIEGIRGNYGRSIELYNMLPTTKNNVINLSIVYWKKFKEALEEKYLRAALENLDRIDLEGLEEHFLRRIYHIRALIYQAQKQYDVADKYYQQAMELAEGGLRKGQILNDYASLFIDLNDYEKAQELLLAARRMIDAKSKKEISINSKWLQILAEKQLEEGKKYYQEGKYVEAIEVFSSIINKTSQSEVHKYLGRCYFWLENYDAAYRNFLYLSEYGEGDLKEYGASMIATIMDEIWGRTDQAIELLKSLPSSPRNLVSLLVFNWKKYSQTNDLVFLEKLNTILDQLDEKQVPHFSLTRLFHVKGLIAQNQKDYQKAEVCYEKALELVQNDLLQVKIINDLASLYINTKQFEEADKVLSASQSLVEGKNKVIQEENTYWRNVLLEKQIEEGQKLFEEGEYVKALQIFEQRVGENPVSRYYLARCYFRMEKFKEAFGHFELLQNVTEYSSYSMTMLSVIYAIWGEYSKAVTMMKKLSDTVMNLIYQIYVLLYIHKATNQEWTLIDGEKLMKKVMSQDVEGSARWRFHLACGMIHQALGEYFLARSQYDEALQHVGGAVDRAKVLDELGSMLLEQDELAEAEGVLNEACQNLHQQSIEVGINYKLLGLLQKKQKNYEEAHDYFKEAVKILREKETYREAAEVTCLLINQNKSDFYVSAEYYATLLAYERSLKEMQKENEKVIRILEECLS